MKKPSLGKIAVRSLLIYSPFLVLSIVIVAVFLSIYLKIDMNNINHSQRLILELQKKKTSNSFRVIFSDIRFLSESAVIKRYCKYPEANLNAMEQLFRYFITHKRFYTQIKFF